MAAWLSVNDSQICFDSSYWASKSAWEVVSRGSLRTSKLVVSLQSPIEFVKNDVG